MLFDGAIVGGTVNAVLENSADNETNSFGLSEAIAEQAGAGGSSRGSWFLTQLAYSPVFASDLDSNPLNWFQSGCKAHQRCIFIIIQCLSLMNNSGKSFRIPSAELVILWIGNRPDSCIRFLRK